MKKLFILFSLLLMIAGCVHKMDIEQGNVITPEMSSKLRIGMNESQVEAIMGTPILINTFRDDRIDYVYTFKPGYGKTVEKHITLTFWRGILKDIK